MFIHKRKKNRKALELKIINDNDQKLHALYLQQNATIQKLQAEIVWLKSQIVKSPAQESNDAPFNLQEISDLYEADNDDSSSVPETDSHRHISAELSNELSILSDNFKQVEDTKSSDDTLHAKHKKLIRHEYHINKMNKMKFVVRFQNFWNNHSPEKQLYEAFRAMTTESRTVAILLKMIKPQSIKQIKMNIATFEILEENLEEFVQFLNKNNDKSCLKTKQNQQYFQFSRFSTIASRTMKGVLGKYSI